MRVCRWLSLIPLVITLAACGATHKAAQPVPAHTVATPNAPQLVSMRRTDGATWETLVIRTDGTGDLGIFIGEWSGTKHHELRLAPDELARVKGLVHTAERLPQSVDRGTSASSVTYVIFAGPRVFLTAKGHVPRQLARLTGTLSGLIDQQEGAS